ncbi:MAG: winged helix-turn-helix domain-containing protein [Longimicrobiales bacterium]
MAAKRESAARSGVEVSPTPASLGSIPGQGAEGGPLELDRLIHERVRLGIVSALAVNGTMPFTDLRGLLGTTDGNLSAHARRLEDAGYVLCHKSFEGRTPRTDFELTPRGRKALRAYLDHMEAIIRATRDSEAGA